MSLRHSFSGKRVLVTGGGSGIGRQLVEKLYADGAIIFTIDKNPESLQKLKEELPGENLKAEVCDIGDWEETKKIVESFGVIDHLVNNAGILLPSSFLNITEDHLVNLYKVNLFGMINTSQVVAKGLIKAGRSGTIVNLSSLASRRCGLSILTGYATTKAAIENLTKSMAIELGAHNIRVNCVLPGAVETSIHDNSPPEIKAAIAAGVAGSVSKRIILPEEVADLILFLLSPLSAMIIGEAVVIDGGI